MVRESYMKKILLILFFIFMPLGAVQVSLNIKSPMIIKDEDTGHTIPAVYENEGFEILVKVENGGRNTSDVELLSADSLNITGRGQSSSINVINNNFTSDISYNYFVSVNKLGLKEIGPARVTENGKSFESNKVLFKVIKRGEEKNIEKSKKEKPYDLFCKLEADKLSVVEGEPVELSLKIYSHGQILQVGMGQANFNGFDVKEIEENLIAQEEIENTIYSVLTKKYILIPTDIGKKNIDPIRISYNVKEKRKHSRHDFFDMAIDSMFLGGGVKTEHVMSNSLQINVKPLPAVNNNIDAIGQFSELKVFTDKNEVIVNEPILLTLQVSGFGGLDQIVAPTLNLPEGFTYYKSKSSVQREEKFSVLAGKKTFEYVVQVDKLGEHVIKPQEFIFFDPKENNYKTLKSNSILLKITIPQDPGSLLNNNDSDNNFFKENIEVSNDIEYQKDINFISEDLNFLSKSSDKEISLISFLILFFLPLLFFAKKLFKKIFNFLFIGFVNKQLPAKLEKDLNEIISQKKANLLYDFFVKYFALTFGINKPDVTENYIENKLEALELEKEKVDSFLSYLHLCASLSFAGCSESFLDKEKLLDKSKYWFFMLESTRR
jgi:hypothetical protein